MFSCRNCGHQRKYAYSKVGPEGAGTHYCICGWFLWHAPGFGYYPVGG